MAITDCTMLILCFLYVRQWSFSKIIVVSVTQQKPIKILLLCILYFHGNSNYIYYVSDKQFLEL